MVFEEAIKFSWLRLFSQILLYMGFAVATIGLTFFFGQILLYTGFAMVTVGFASSFTNTSASLLLILIGIGLAISITGYITNEYAKRFR